MNCFLIYCYKQEGGFVYRDVPDTILPDRHYPDTGY